MILALDLSTPRGALAVVSPAGDVIFDQHFRAHRSHNALVFEPLKRAIEACGMEGPSCVVIGTGPGSYTGVRVAISAGTGIAMAKRIPLIGWPSAPAASKAADTADPFLFVGDARRGKYYGIEVDPGEPSQEFEPTLFEPEGMSEWLKGKETMKAWTFDTKPPEPCERAKVTFPDPANLGRMLVGLDKDQLGAISSSALEPVYLSAPFITVPKSR